MKNVTMWGGRTKKFTGDFYETPEAAVKKILERELITGKILEPCNGKGAISKHLSNVSRWDINPDFEYDECKDFLSTTGREEFDVVITNPPYGTNSRGEFVLKALEHVKPGGKVIMFLKFVYIESLKRRPLFKVHPPKKIYVFSKRFKINGGSGIPYAWYVWEKGFKGDTVLTLE